MENVGSMWMERMREDRGTDDEQFPAKQEVQKSPPQHQRQRKLR